MSTEKMAVASLFTFLEEFIDESEVIVAQNIRVIYGEKNGGRCIISSEDKVKKQKTNL